MLAVWLARQAAIAVPVLAAGFPASLCGPAASVGFATRSLGLPAVPQLVLGGVGVASPGLDDCMPGSPPLRSRSGTGRCESVSDWAVLCWSVESLTIESSLCLEAKLDELTHR